MPLNRSPRRPGGPLIARLWACCAIGVSAALTSCGGRATDGLEPGANGPSVSIPADEPSLVRPVRETCADNPLLAGCPSASLGGNSPSPREEPEAIPDEEPLYVAAARNVLISHCGACHGSLLTEAQASGAINYIDDWNQLIQAGLIEECSPGRSRIIAVMRSGEMPPPRLGLPAVPDAEIAFVANAIELDCNAAR